MNITPSDLMQWSWVYGDYRRSPHFVISEFVIPAISWFGFWQYFVDSPLFRDFEDWYLIFFNIFGISFCTEVFSFHIFALSHLFTFSSICHQKFEHTYIHTCVKHLKCFIGNIVQIFIRAWVLQTLWVFLAKGYLEMT